jgi:hypothetical protein
MKEKCYLSINAEKYSEQVDLEMDKLDEVKTAIRDKGWIINKIGIDTDKDTSISENPIYNDESFSESPIKKQPVCNNCGIKLKLRYGDEGDSLNIINGKYLCDKCTDLARKMKSDV